MESEGNATAPQVPSTSNELATISLSARIPEFWQDQPRLWFIQVEAILAQQKANDQTCYNIVVAKLGKEVIQQVADILGNPPEQGKFKALKARLLEVYEESEARQLHKLMSEMDLGDQRPSQLLRRMRDLARRKIPDDTMTILWQGHLPPSVRAVLVATQSKDLDNLGAVADQVMETFRPNEIATVARAGVPIEAPQASQDIIIAELAKLNLRIDELSRERARGRYRSVSRGRTPSRQRSRSRITPDSPEWLCFYHYRFKSRANKCEEPCNWKKRSEN